MVTVKKLVLYFVDICSLVQKTISRFLAGRSRFLAGRSRFVAVGKIIKVELSAALEPKASQDLKLRSMLC